jgi:DNA-binding NarL/FixJ family response regulator
MERLNQLVNQAHEIVKALSFSLPSFIKILYIDDSFQDYEIFKRILDFPGKVTYEVSHVSSSLIGLQKILERTFDIYLIDFKLDGPYTGIEIVKRASELGVNGPFLICSAYQSESFFELALAENFIGYIPKDIVTIKNIEQSYRAIDMLLRFSLKTYRIHESSRQFLKTYNRLVSEDYCK